LETWLTTQGIFCFNAARQLVGAELGWAATGAGKRAGLDLYSDRTVAYNVENRHRCTTVASRQLQCKRNLNARTSGSGGRAGVTRPTDGHQSSPFAWVGMGTADRGTSQQWATTTAKHAAVPLVTKAKQKRLQSDVGRNKTRDAVARVALISFGCASATATA
jgi:hypothetical protein